MSWFEFGYFGLFIVCFLSATIIPLPSEGALITFLVAGYSPLMCLIIASFGNVLGSTTNYAIGMLGNPKDLQKRVRNPERLKTLQRWTKRFGPWLGFISWVPFIGDPLTIVAGFFRVRFLPFLIAMAFAKFARYAVIIILWIE